MGRTKTPAAVTQAVKFLREALELRGRNFSIF